MKKVTVWDKLKLQIDNLEMMHKQHELGNDMSNMVYWQVETIHDLLKSVEEHMGANEIRKQYDSSVW